MLFQKIALISTLAALVPAQDISQDDIPQQCTAICAEVVAISRQCDDQTSKRLLEPLLLLSCAHNFQDDDAAELQCICTAPNANTLIPNCEACVAEFDNDDDDTDDNSVDENGRLVLLRS